MQATSSQVIAPSVSTNSVFTIDMIDQEPGVTIFPVLQRAAKASGRDHLLVRRRRRDNRRRAH